MKKNLLFSVSLYWFAFLWLIFCCWDPCNAQYSPWESFNTAQGLGDVEVYTIYESPTTGDLWFGTRNGATQYDGTWKNFDLDISQSSGNRVQAIIEDDFHTLWFGTERGIKVFANGTVSSCDTNILNEEEVWEIAKGDFAKLWFGTSNGAWCFDQKLNSWVHFLDDTIIQAITKDKSENIWFGTSKGRIYILKNNQTPVLSIDIGAAITDLFVDNNGRLIAATDGLKVYFFENESWHGIMDTNLYSEVTGIEQDWEGTFWFATKENGIAYCNSTFGGWEKLKIDNSGIPSNIINDVKEDSYGNIWIAMKYAGVARYDKSWKAFVKGKDSRYTARAIENDHDNNIWLGFSGAGLYKYDGQNLHTIIDSLKNIKIFAISKDSNSKMWFGTDKNGVKCYYGNKLIDTLMYSGTIYSILADSKNCLWFGTSDKGVLRYEQGDTIPKIFDSKNNFADTKVNAIFEDSGDTIWFGTNSGISYYSDGKMHTIRKDSISIIPDIITSIAEDDEGILWFGSTYNGILKYTPPQTWEILKTSEGLSNTNIYSVVFDQINKRLWVGTDRGANCLIMNGDNYEWQLFSPQTSGLPDRIVKSLFVNYKIIEGEKRTSSVWFGESTCAARYVGIAFPPNTFILTSNDTTIGVSRPIFKVKARDNISSPSEISYSYLVFKKDSIGIHKYPIGEWSKFQFGSTVIVNESLGNGDYEIQIRARDSDGNIEPTPAMRNFSIDLTLPVAVINSPMDGEHLTQKILIKGVAYDDDFSIYEVNYRRFSEDIWMNAGIQYPRSNTIAVKVRDILAIWDCSILPEICASYQLRLTVKDHLGHIVSQQINVIIDKLAMAKEVSQSGDYMVSSFGAKKVQLYIPPNSLNKIVAINLTTLDSSDGDISMLSIAKNADFVGYEIVSEDNTLLELDKVGILSITDPCFANRGRNLVLYSKKVDKNYSNWQRVGGTFDPTHNEMSAPFKEFGKYIIIDTLMEVPQALFEEFNCQPRAFSTKNNSLLDHTTIIFSLKSSQLVTINVYNVAGRLIRNLITNKVLSEGANSVTWDGKDDEGKICSSGLYIICVQFAGDKKIKTVAIINN